LQSRWKYVYAAIAAFLVGLNLFQIWQYNRTILHYNDMNRRYYQAIFLKAHPTPLDMSLLDTPERLASEAGFSRQVLVSADSTYQINSSKQAQVLVYQQEMSGLAPDREQWLRITAEVRSDWGAFDSHLITRLEAGGQTKETACRLQNGICEPKTWNTIDYYFRIPADHQQGKLTILAETKTQEDIFVKNVRVQLLTRE
ncbi:MAG: hypothetical protein ABIQ93_10935, partial [Saprospiraceae bacterium]